MTRSILCWLCRLSYFARWRWRRRSWARRALGDGRFQPARAFELGSYPSGISIGDFNGDSQPDLAITNAFSHNVSILLGQGNGDFHQAHNLTVGRRGTWTITSSPSTRWRLVTTAVTTVRIGDLDLCYFSSFDGFLNGVLS